MQPYKHQGKERLEFAGTGAHDHGARMAHNAIGRWTVMDPLMEKYYPVSPYVYCGNNPVMLIDKDGRKIVVSGTLSTAAVNQMQAGAGNTIKVSMNEKGELSYTSTGSSPLEGHAKIIAGIIDDNDITVNMATTNLYETSTGNLMVGGSFMGNTVSENEDGSRSVSARQEVNPNVLGTADEHTQTPREMIMHELTEAYEGAKMSQESGVSSPRAGEDGSVYETAHNRATEQSTVRDFMYKENGRKTTQIEKAKRVEWYVSKKGVRKIIQKYPN